MKSKKLISLLCAAAMSASSFASLAITASAATESDILWSDTFNNQSAGIIADGTKSQITKSDYVNGLTFVTTNRGNGDAGCYTATDGTYIYNGSYYAIKDDKTDKADKYLRLSFPVFGDYEDTAKGRWAHVDLGEGYAATDDKDVVMDFDLKMNDGLTKGEVSTVNPVLRFGSFESNTATAIKIDKAANSLGNDWVHARIIVSASTGAKLYISGEEVTSAANTNVKALNTIGLYSESGTSNCGDAMADIVGNSTYDDGSMGDPTKLTQTPTVDMDNVIIYNEVAGVATGKTEAPGAQNQAGGATPEPIATPKVIPAASFDLKAPSAATDVQSYNFDNVAAKKWSLGTETIEDSTTIPGINVYVGARSSGGTVDTYAAVVKIAQGNALQLATNRYGTAGRAPRINFTNSLPVSVDENKSTALTFNVYLSAVEGKEAEATPRLFFLKDATQAGSDGFGAYRNVAAVLTTVEDEVIYRGDDSSSDVISAYVTPNEWHKVTMVITPGSDKNTHRVYIDDDYDKASISVNYVATGENATKMEDLPYLAVESKAAKVDGVDTTPSYGVATIDNILAYQGVVDNPKKLLPTTEAAPTPAPVPAKVTMTVDESANTVTLTSDKDTNAVLVQSSYRTDNTLDSVKKVVNLELKAGEAKTVPSTDLATFTTNDKIMVWDSLKTMTPLANVYTIKSGATQATAKPAPTVAPTATPEVTVEPTATAVATDAPDATAVPTATPDVTPVPTATPVPTYTVTGTVDAGVKTVTLTDKANAENKITGTIADTTVTFTGVVAGTYTVSATATDGKEIDTIKVGDADVTEVTVTDANVTNLAITSKDEAVIPYADGTITYDADGAVSSFADYSRVTASVKDGANGNTTKVQDLLTGSGGQSGAGYNPFTEAYPAKGEAIAVSYDVSIPTRNAWVSLRGTKPGTSNRNNDATGRIFTIGADGSGIVKVYSGTDVVDSISDTDITAKWYHVDAVVNNTTKKVAIKIYNYKANNNYTKETAIYDKTVDFRDNTVTGVVAMDYYSNVNGAHLQLDNLYINDTTYVAPINVTAKGATVDKVQVMKDDVITITPTVPTGKKLSAVKVNGTEVTATEGKYTYTVLGTELAIAVTTEYVRADVDNVVISSTNSDVQIGTTGKYTAVAYADADKKVAFSAEDAPVTWSIAPATEGGVASIVDGTAIAQDGTLTVASAQTEGKITVKAEVTKDITSDDETDANKVVGTFDVNVISEPSYQVVAATIENGSVSFKVGETNNAVAFKQSETLEIVPVANAGYELDKVSYRLTSAEDTDANYTDVTADEDKYTVAGTAVTGNITVKVTFKAIDYTVTNSNADADANGNKLTVDKATANVGDTVTITPTLEEGTKMALSIKDAANDDVSYTEGEKGAYTFVMPASNVTISAKFDKVKTIELDASKILGTYVDFRSDNADTSYISTNEGKYSFGQCKVSGGKVVASNTAYADTSIVAIVSVDASEYAGKVYGATMTYDMTAGANNSWINAIGTYENYIDLGAEGASVTGNNVNTLGGTATNTYTFAAWTYCSTKNTTVTKTTPIDNIFTQDAEGKVTMYMYTGTGRLQTLSNVKITLTVADDSTTETE